MEFRQLGGSGLRVPVLSFGTATFGGGTGFKAWGETDLTEAKRMIGVCLEFGINMFDTADIYSQGVSEEILGKALVGKRNDVLISTKATFPMNYNDQNAMGSSRYHLIRACEDSLRRLQTDHIDIYHMHGFDATTPVDEVLSTLDTLVRSGKVRYIACSNFSGWHLMKSLSLSERYGWTRYVAHQAYYSLAGREFEWELMPLGIDQKVGTLVWSPLANGALSGKVRRDRPAPAGSRLSQVKDFNPVEPEYLYKIMDAMDPIVKETGKSHAQIALNWLLQRPTVCNIVVGARNEEQLKQNIGAVGWKLSPEQIAALDAASDTRPVYPYWHQRMNQPLNPLPV